MKKKVIIFDANNLFFASFCANPTINFNNVHIGGILSSLQIIQKICKDVKPHELIFVWDGKGSTKRRKILNENYKEGRSAPKPLTLNRTFQYASPEQEAENRRWQQARFIEILNHCPVIQVIESGVEADDIISYLAQKYNQDGVNIVVSNDKDYLQIVEKNILLYRFTSKMFYSKDDVTNQYNILPSNMALARAIEGDKSDNLIGVQRVGLKTVVKYFPEFKKEENLTFDRLFELAEKKNKEKTTVALPNIIASRELIENNYKIMQLYSPLIDAHTAISIDQVIKDKEIGFSITAFNLQIMKDGMRYIDFIDLIDHFIAITNFFKKNKVN